MTDQVLNKRKFLFRFRLKNQEDIIYITSFDLILIFQWDLLKETNFWNQVRCKQNGKSNSETHIFYQEKQIKKVW